MFRDKRQDAEQQFAAKCARVENGINRALTTAEQRSHFSFNVTDITPSVSAEIEEKPNTPKM